VPVSWDLTDASRFDANMSVLESGLRPALIVATSPWDKRAGVGAVRTDDADLRAQTKVSLQERTWKAIRVPSGDHRGSLHPGVSVIRVGSPSGMEEAITKRS
jgi:hypothetical protein